MEPRRRELLVARVLAGVVRFSFEGRTYSVGQGGLSLASQERYEMAYEEAQESGIYSEEEALSCLKKRGLWSDTDEKLLEDLGKHIDDFKVELYTASLRVGEMRTVRKALDRARSQRDELHARRQQWAFLTCSGVAQLVKIRQQAGDSLRVGGRYVWPEGEFWDDSEATLLLDAAVEALASSRLTESELRELARTEPWGSLWRVSGCCQGVLACSASEATDEQKQLILWTQFYDGARQSQDCPPDEVFEDDDIMDGWAILRRREAERAASQRRADSRSTDKIRSCQEVFLPARNAEEARRIHGLNDRAAELVKNQHLSNLAARGRLEEHQRPEVQRQLQMEAVAARRR